MCNLCCINIALSEARDCITIDTKYNFHHSDWTQQAENKISHVQRDWWESGQPSSETHLSDQEQDWDNNFVRDKLHQGGWRHLLTDCLKATKCT